MNKEPSSSTEVPNQQSTRDQKNGRDSKWKRGRGNKSRMPRTNVYAPKIENSSGSIPQGSHLSKVPTELSNDPLSQKAYFPGTSEEFRTVATRYKVYSGCTVLPLVCDETYQHISTVSPSFAKTTPRGAYDYYVAVQVYYRLMLLHHKNGGSLTLGELNFIEHMEQAQYTVPKSISLFLSGLGNTKAPKSREIQFGFLKPRLIAQAFRVRDYNVNIPGFFGPILENLGLYSGYPCLAVYILKILHDLYRTENQQHPAQWDLPENIRDPRRAVNMNCLGYRDNQPLSNEHRQFYHNVNFSLDDAEFSNIDLPINDEILNAVHIKLSHSRLTLFPCPVTSVGSVGQLCCEQISTQNTHRSITAHYVAHTSYELPSCEGYLGSTFLYNVCKTNTENRVMKSQCPVTFGATSAFGPDLAQNLDTLYRHTVPWIKTSLYANIEYSPVLRMESVVLLDTPGI